MPQLEGIIDFGGSWEHACALLRDGRVFCMGANDAGQAGNFDLMQHCGAVGAPDNPNRFCVRRPTEVPGIHDAVKLSVGVWQTCVIRRDGTVWCWGSDDALADGLGALGDGLPPDEYCGLSLRGGPQPCRRRPVRVRGIENAVDVAVGDDINCAVLANGETWCWGWELLGDWTNNPSGVPVRVRWH